MKKLGFTLSEVIIALGIVGIVATITTPMISSLIPDKNKALVLKTYKIISGINEDLLNTPAYYLAPTKDQASLDYCIKLGCTQPPKLEGLTGNEFSGTNKYPRLLAYHLDTEGAVTSSKFVTIDKAVWTFSGAHTATGGNVEITVDFNGDKGPNAVFSSSNKKPDRFKFKVDVHGGVTGADPLTKAYLANPYKLNDRANDYKNALEP